MHVHQEQHTEVPTFVEIYSAFNFFTWYKQPTRTDIWPAGIAFTGMRFHIFIFHSMHRRCVSMPVYYWNKHSYSKCSITDCYSGLRTAAIIRASNRGWFESIQLDRHRRADWFGRAVTRGIFRLTVPYQWNRRRGAPIWRIYCTAVLQLLNKESSDIRMIGSLDGSGIMVSLDRNTRFMGWHTIYRPI